MTVGVLLLTHESMGAALVNAARHVLGRLPLSVEVQEVAANADPDQMLRSAAANARELDHGILRALWLDRDEVASAGARLRSPMVLASIDDWLAGRRLPLDAIRSLRVDP